jgi:hypothetical protein
VVNINIINKIITKYSRNKKIKPVPNTMIATYERIDGKLKLVNRKYIDK